jgi:hypothetical protein
MTAMTAAFAIGRVYFLGNATVLSLFLQGVDRKLRLAKNGFLKYLPSSVM